MTTKYLKITNKADSVSRINLEKLGLSTKRNDPSTIGQFGSGIKFAPIAALRNGWEWWFTGTDAKGQYCMKYTTEIEDGVKCIAFDYGDYTKSSSFTLEAGGLSWVSPFQIYREAVANAMDEAKSDDDWSVSIVDYSEIKPVDGEFSVFITAAPEIVDIHNDFDKYFAVDREVIATYQGLDFLRKIDDNLRIYCHRVMVHESDMNSIFDYNDNHLNLNEERTISSIWDLEWQISRALIKINDDSIVERVIKAGNSGLPYFEFEKFQTGLLKFEDPSIAWSRSFEFMYGENCVIYDAHAVQYGVVDAIKMRGYKPVLISSTALYEIFKAAGIKDYLSIIGEECQMEIDYNIDLYPNLVSATRIASAYIPEINDLIRQSKIGVFRADMDQNLGMTLNASKSRDERIILINGMHVTDTIEDIVATLVHEYDHLNTGVTDSAYRQFRDIADKRIASLMLRFYKFPFFEISDGVLKFPMDKIAYLGSNLNFIIENVSSRNISIITVGNKSLFINGDAVIENMSGSLIVSDIADSLVVPGLTNVTTVGVIDV